MRMFLEDFQGHNVTTGNYSSAICLSDLENPRTNEGISNFKHVKVHFLYSLFAKKRLFEGMPRIMF